MVRYAHDVLQNPVEFAQTVEQIRSLGIENPEGKILRAIEESRQLKKKNIEKTSPSKQEGA